MSHKKFIFFLGLIIFLVLGFSVLVILLTNSLIEKETEKSKIQHVNKEKQIQQKEQEIEVQDTGPLTIKDEDHEFNYFLTERGIKEYKNYGLNSKGPGKDQKYKLYSNDQLGISIVYWGHPDSYVEEVEDSTIRQKDFYGKGNEYGKGLEILRIFKKDPEQSIEDAIGKLATINGADMNKCKVVIEEKGGPGPFNWDNKIMLKYIVDFEFDDSKCLPTDEGPQCSYRQWGEYNEIAARHCSEYEYQAGRNRFIYQAENTKSKYVFAEHLGGMDAASWGLSTLKLFDKEE